MTRFLLQVLNSRLKLPTFIVYAALSSYNRIYQVFKLRTLWSDVERKRILEIINSTRQRELLPLSPSSLGSISINIVATDKDINLLIQVINFSLNALPNFEIASVRIIVPEYQISIFAQELKRINRAIRFELIPEEEIVPYKYGRDIFNAKFPSRSNWCYQQFLKVGSVLTSNSKFALVVDCDTLLLNPRAWINRNSFTNVMPTLEYEPQYEELLRRLGLNNFNNQWSFVPHHMLYEVDDLRRLLSDLGIESVIELAARVEALANRQLLSPFCIDYSLYGHSVFSKKGNDALIRWANLELPRRVAYLFKVNSTLSRFASLLFNSISFHSWKDKS